MDEFFTRERAFYEQKKAIFERERLAKRKKGEFMTFEHYTRHREQTSPLLLKAYEKLLEEPRNRVPKLDYELDTKYLEELSDY